MGSEKSKNHAVGNFLEKYAPKITKTGSEQWLMGQRQAGVGVRAP